MTRRRRSARSGERVDPRRMGGLPGPELGLLRQEVAELVRARQHHPLGERVDVEVDRRAVRAAARPARRGRPSAPRPDRRRGARTAGRGVGRSTTIGSTPFLRLLLRKMSANEVDRIARTPHAVSAHGACSRDEPAPKLSPTSRIAAARPSPGWSRTKRRLLERAVLLEPPVAEERLGEAVLVGHLEVARRDDLVGVDVLGRQRDDPAGEDP